LGPQIFRAPKFLALGPEASEIYLPTLNRRKFCEKYLNIRDRKWKDEVENYIEDIYNFGGGGNKYQNFYVKRSRKM
jgi:hypothetical protein